MEHSSINHTNPPVLEVTDHFKSGETFGLYEHPEHGYLMTQPTPSQERLPYYYDSDAYISHTDSKKGLFSKAYQMVKGISLKRKAKLIARHQHAPGRILDVGAGTGDFLKYMRDMGWDVSGSEPNQSARQLSMVKGVELKESIGHFQSDRFNLISLWHVLEHIPDLEENIEQLYTLLEDDGTLIVAVPNFRSFDAEHYGRFWAAYDVPRHLWHFDRNSMESLLGDRFELKEVAPMKFDSYYVSLLSEKYKGGSLGMIKAIWNGWRSNLKAASTGEYSSLIYVLSPKPA